MQTVVEYKGWSLYDKVIIVERKGYTEKDISQGYVVDPKNKKSLKSARGWATTYKYDEDHNPVRDADGRMVEVEPEEFLLDNEGFKVKLSESANGSSQGGKLSFWNCIISKGDKQWLIGINAELLLHLLMQSISNE